MTPIQIKVNGKIVELQINKKYSFVREDIVLERVLKSVELMGDYNGLPSYRLWIAKEGEESALGIHSSSLKMITEI